MIHSQVFYGDDFEFTMRAHSRYGDDAHRIIDLMYEISNIATKAFHATIDTDRSDYDRTRPASVIAVNIGPFGIRFRIFSRGEERLKEMFHFLVDVEQRVGDADL